MITIKNIHSRSVETINLTGSNAETYKQLKLDGHKVRVNSYGLKVSGRRVSWLEGWLLAFLGTPIGKTPKIIRTL